MGMLLNRHEHTRSVASLTATRDQKVNRRDRLSEEWAAADADAENAQLALDRAIEARDAEIAARERARQRLQGTQRDPSDIDDPEGGESAEDSQEAAEGSEDDEGEDDE